MPREGETKSGKLHGNFPRKSSPESQRSIDKWALRRTRVKQCGKRGEWRDGGGGVGVGLGGKQGQECRGQGTKYLLGFSFPFRVDFYQQMKFLSGQSLVKLSSWKEDIGV